MAKQDFSFDIVSEVSMPEVSNAVDQARREIAQRFDFKDTGTALSAGGRADRGALLDRGPPEGRLEVLKEKAVRREISLKALQLRAGRSRPRRAPSASRSTSNVGISDEKASEISKFVQGRCKKVQSQIQGDQVRVTRQDQGRPAGGRCARSRRQDFGVALQFTNSRPWPACTVRPGARPTLAVRAPPGRFPRAPWRRTLGR